MEYITDIALGIEDSEDRDLIRYSQENAALKVKIAVLERKLARFNDYVNPDESKNCLFDRLKREIAKWEQRYRDEWKTSDKLRHDNAKLRYDVEHAKQEMRKVESNFKAMSDRFTHHSELTQRYEKLQADHMNLQGFNRSLQARLEKLDTTSLEAAQGELNRLKPELEQYRHFFGNMYYVLKQVKTN